MKIIVLGTGAMGAAACAHLSRRGHEVVGLDRFSPPHEKGSHHGDSRMIRQSYGEHPDYVPLLLRSYELWRELEEQSGERVMFETGGLYMGPPGAPMVDGALKAARLHALPHELLNSDEIRQRFPVFDFPDDFEGFFEQRAGYVVPEKAISAHLQVALQSGAQILPGQEVVGWEVGNAGVTVRTANSVHQADRMIVTAGAWVNSCLGDIGVPMEVTRQVLAWVGVGDHPSRAAFETMPGWFREMERPFGYYGFPLPHREDELKFALHALGRVIGEEDFEDVHVSSEEVATLREFARSFLGVDQNAGLRTRVCRYTNTPDGHFVIGHHPADSRVTIAAGFSGHGFKFSSVIGEILADLAVDGETRHPISLFDPGRFAVTG